MHWSEGSNRTVTTQRTTQIRLCRQFREFKCLKGMAGTTGLEPAASAVTGGRSPAGPRRINRLGRRLSATVGLIGLRRLLCVQRFVQRALASPTEVVDAMIDRFALSLPSHVRFHVAQGYTLSISKQVHSGHVDTVIKTVERNVPVRLRCRPG